MALPPGAASSRVPAAWRCRHRHALARSNSNSPQIGASVQPALMASSINTSRTILGRLSTRAGIGPLKPSSLSPQRRQLDRLLHDHRRQAGHLGPQLG
jgi:hypothetical protein